MHSMTQFYPCAITLDSEVVSLLEEVARKQGSLSSLTSTGGGVQRDLEVEHLAAVDAVHFSTRIEGC